VHKTAAQSFISFISGKAGVRVAVIFLTILLMAVRVPLATGSSKSPLVRTTYGSVEGTVEPGLLVFRGIPYAAPPVGKLRWRPPVAPSPWKSVRPARSFAPICPQVQEPGESGALPPMSEDCLGLNIWTPGADSGKRPVMVFIHGGAFMEGGTNGAYNGATLARRGGLVFVNFQYRIGTLGFLELADMGGPAFAESGNLGILDQIAALQWVHANVASFGGDPDNVLLFGESAGAVSVATLLATDRAQGLFQKALLESPRAPFVVTKVRATRIALQEMTLAGTRTFQEFERLSWQALMAAQAKLFDARFEDTSFSPVLDGAVLAEPAQRRIFEGRSAQVPVVIGTNLEELKFWELGEGLPLSSLEPDAVARHLEPLLGGKANPAVDLYIKDNPDHSRGEGIILLLSDLTFRMTSIRIAEAQSERQPTWMYIFSYRGPQYGAGHAAELSYVFGSHTPPGSSGTEQERKILQDQIQESWISFARNGSPNHAGLPQWPTYDTRTRATMEFGIPSKLVPDPYPAQRKVWDDVPFDGLKPDIDQASGLMTIGGGGKYWKWTEADQ
jgi:para-nitrobenzyl esterase